MTRTRWRLRSAAAGLALVMGSGCGGGGGDGGGSSQPQAPDTRLTVDSSTYASAYGLVFGSVGTQTALSLLASSAFQVFLQIPGMTPLSVPCPDAGNAALMAEDRDGNAALSAGDRLTHRLQQCTAGTRVSDELVYIDVLDTAVQGNPDRVRLKVTVSQLDATHTDRSDAFRATGEFTLDIVSTVIEERFIVDLERLTVTQSEPGRSQTSRFTEGSLDYQQNYQSDTFRISTAGQVHVENAFVNGYITFDTGAALTGTLGRYPTAGRVTVHGFNNGFARIEEGLAGDTAGSTVTLSLDANDRSPVDSTSVINWATLVTESLFSSFYDTEVR